MQTNKIILGDWCRCKHGQTAEIVYQCNLTDEEQCTAIKKGIHKSGLDVYNLCNDFRDCYIYPQDVETIIKFDLLPRKELEILENKRDSDKYEITPLQFAHMILGVVKCGNGNFSYKIKDKLTDPLTNIKGYVGYGLFTPP